MKTPIVVYRLQHKTTLLGPFEHTLKNGKQSKIANRLVCHSDPNSFPEFKIWLNQLGLNGNVDIPKCWVFGWGNKDIMMKFTRSGTNVKIYGFEIVEYKATEYLLLPDGQVVFKR